jgi:hypothetical protein
LNPSLPRGQILYFVQPIEDSSNKDEHLQVINNMQQHIEKIDSRVSNIETNVSEILQLLKAKQSH